MERLWQWESTDGRECEWCGRQRTVYHYLRKSDRLVPVISIRLGARLSNRTTFVIFHILLCSPVLSIRHFFHPQVTSSNFPSITSSDCHFLSIIITIHFRSSFTTLLWLAMGIHTDLNRRLRCGSGRVGVLFTSISTSGTGNARLSVRSIPSNAVLKTGHGQAGLALFIALYGLIPLLFLASYLRWRIFASSTAIVGKIRERTRADSSDTAEKLNSYRTAADTNQQGAVRSSAPPSSPGHTPSRKPVGLWFRSKDVKGSSETASESESPVQRTFEVINRPARTRNPSASGTPIFHEHAHNRSSNVPRNLSELSWLERRRSVNAMVRTKVNGQGHLTEMEAHRAIWTTH